MEANANTAAEPSDRVLVITRIFDAPRALVFKAWTDPQHRVRWLGPKGFEGTILNGLEVRTGAAYRFHMRSPEGTDHWLQGIYREVVEPERIVCTYAWADENGNATRPETLLTVTFEPYGEAKTKLTLHQAVFESVSACDLHRGGWSTSLDRLAEYVAQMG